jgi:preprotein translocase subunit SecG
MLQTIVLLTHLVVASLIIVLVLIQRGKGADAGTGFGAGASGTVFGSRGSSSFFSRATGILATLFFATSLSLAYFATQAPAPESILEGSVLDDLEQSAGSVVSELPALDSGAAGELPDLEIGEASNSEVPEN